MLNTKKSNMDTLSKEFKYYLDNQDELLKTYNNRVLVIVNEKVVGDFDDFDQAFFSSIKRYEPGTFLVQECTEGDEAYTDTFHSPVFL